MVSLQKAGWGNKKERFRLVTLRANRKQSMLQYQELKGQIAIKSYNKNRKYNKKKEKIDDELKEPVCFYFLLLKANNVHICHQ